MTCITYEITFLFTNHSYYFLTPSIPTAGLYPIMQHPLFTIQSILSGSNQSLFMEYYILGCFMLKVFKLV